MQLDLNIFREYDIRGVYPTMINEQVAYLIGRSYGSYLREKLNQNTCVVGHDNRLSSPSLSDALIKGITESGCNVIDYGLVTTPMHYYSRYLNYLYGIMVTASHNPKDDNGFKFSFDHLANARGDMIREFRDYTTKAQFLSGQGTITRDNIMEKYIAYMKNNINLGQRRRKVIIDCGNGTTSIVARKIHEKFNVDFEIIYEESNGNFPNHHPDPSIESNLTELKKRVVKERADFGIAYDGDGDRVGIIDDEGKFVPADIYMILMIRDLIGKVNKKTFLYDVKCTKALEDEINKLGGTPLIYRTGASYTQAKLKEDDLPFGGEYSGHIYFRDRDTDLGSGIYAGLRLLEIMSKNNYKLSDMIRTINKYSSTPEIKVQVPDTIKFQIIENMKNYCIGQNWPVNDIDGIRVNFSNGWALVRASNTGPNITLRFEAIDTQTLNNLKNIFTNLLNENLKLYQ
ncbi:MAG: phosphomannomutase/phosphoglucomutase [Bacilli bacterium]|nr:phosphomannomutase/phosphoglucomutase [Bacilli bacterium]